MIPPMPEAISDARRALIDAMVAAMYERDVTRAARLQELAHEVEKLIPEGWRRAQDEARLAQARA